MVVRQKVGNLTDKRGRFRTGARLASFLLLCARSSADVPGTPVDWERPFSPRPIPVAFLFGLADECHPDFVPLALAKRRWTYKRTRPGRPPTRPTFRELRREGFRLADGGQPDRANAAPHRLGYLSNGNNG